MNRRAFSLVELMIVMAIMAVLIAFVSPAVNMTLGANNITQGGEELVQQIDSARQLAAVRGLTAELRFLKKTGETDYTGMQVFLLSNGTANAVSKAVAMPQAVAVIDNADLSPWLNMLSSGTMPSGGPWGSASYKAFRVRPSGAIEPAPAAADRSKLFLTVAGAHTPPGTKVVNYATVQVNPDTARPLLYRP